MTPTTLTTLALAGLAAVLAWCLGGASGNGVFAGCLAAASVTGAWLWLQQRIARARPQFLFHAVLGGFLVKACALLLCTAIVRYVPLVSERVDWFSFALSFGATTLVILVPATIEVLKTLQVRSLQVRSGAAGASPAGGEGRPA